MKWPDKKGLAEFQFDHLEEFPELSAWPWVAACLLCGLKISEAQRQAFI
jgi:hypothetical protein